MLEPNRPCPTAMTNGLMWMCKLRVNRQTWMLVEANCSENISGRSGNNPVTFWLPAAIRRLQVYPCPKFRNISCWIELGERPSYCSCIVHFYTSWQSCATLKLQSADGNQIHKSTAALSSSTSIRYFQTWVLIHDAHARKMVKHN